MDKIQNDNQMLVKAEQVLYEMGKIGELISDGPPIAQIPRSTIVDWYETLDNVLFRLRSLIDE